MKKKRMSLTQKKSLTGLIFIAPWIIGFITFYAKGIIETIIMAFSEVTQNETGGFNKTFNGIANFIYAFGEDKDFNQILVKSVGDILIDVPLIIFFSLFLAIILNGKFKGRTLFRAILFLPVIMGAGVIVDAIDAAQAAVSGGLNAVADNMAVTQDTGMMQILKTFIEFGVPEKLITYLSQAVERIFNVVRASGVQTIIFIAALQSINGSLYEVAKIEGATAYETFWKVTMPMVSPMILTNVVYTIVYSFSNSKIIEKAEEMAFVSFKYGISSAMSLISTIVVCGILLIIGWLISKKVFYYN
jgi:ABC-type sugar transport system permease subunit